MIFRFYYNWITYWLRLSKKETIPGEGYILCSASLDELHKTKGIGYVIDYLSKANDLLDDQIIFIPNRFVWLWKPLGGCIFCFGSWIYIIISLLFTNNLPFISQFITLFLGLGTNYLFIELIQRLKHDKS